MTHSITFDTFYHINKLKSQGVPEKHAEAYVEMIAEIVESKLATTQDMEKIRGEIKLMSYKVAGMLTIGLCLLGYFIKH